MSQKTFYYSDFNKNNTTIKAIVNYNEDGELHGEKLCYYETGEVLARFQYYKGVVKHEITYYKNGQIITEKTYLETESHEFVKHGEWIMYNEDGTIFTIHRYDNNLLHHEYLPAHIRLYDDGSPHTIEYFNKGRLHCLFTSAQTVFSKTGDIEKSVWYKDGLMHNPHEIPSISYRNGKATHLFYRHEGKMIKSIYIAH